MLFSESGCKYTPKFLIYKRFKAFSALFNLKVYLILNQDATMSIVFTFNYVNKA